MDGERHSASRDGLTASHRAVLRIGSGHAGSSYAVQIGGKLFQSPISWYAGRQRLDISPGFENERYPDFDRPIRNECLACHATVRENDWTAIGCERCHGQGEQHLQRPAAANIVNPARLSGAIRDSVCEQCHLSGFIRVLNPGAEFTNFRPGQRLEESWTTFVEGGDFRVTSHAEQWRLSRCRLPDGGTLSCFACHSPHPTASRPARSMDTVCRGCHDTHEASRSGCADCHMPKRGTQDVAHVAYTDHRIRRNEQPPEADRSPLRPWREPLPAVRNRTLALAEVQAARNLEARELARQKLALLPLDDFEVVSLLGSTHSAQGEGSKAVPYLRRAIELKPKDALAHYRLGLAEEQAQAAGFRERYRTAIQLDPGLFDAYVALAQSYLKAGDRERYRETLESYLRIDSQNLTIRAALAKLGR